MVLLRAVAAMTASTAPSRTSSMAFSSIYAGRAATTTGNQQTINNTAATLTDRQSAAGNDTNGNNESNGCADAVDTANNATVATDNGNVEVSNDNSNSTTTSCLLANVNNALLQRPSNIRITENPIPDTASVC